MSSKWNQRPTRRRRPPICIAPPKPSLPPYDGRRPPKLTGFVQWLDLDPLGHQNKAAVITTGPRSPAGLYIGKKTFGQYSIGAEIQDHWPVPAVDVKITYEDPLWGPLDYTFADVPMPLEQPFNTRLLTITFIPVTDLRRAFFME